MTDTAPEWRAFDSSVLILFLNDALAPLHVQALSDALDAGRGQISAVVRAEVLAWSGHTSLSLMVADEFLEAFQLVPVDAAVANGAARVRREHGLKMPDALIAATALLQSATLVTANARDFRRVPALRLVDV